MAALDFERLIDALSTAVEAVVPRSMPGLPFLRYRGATPFEQLGDGFRQFAWDTTGDLVLSGSGADPLGAQSDAAGCWWALRLKLRVQYPQHWHDASGEVDATARGLDVLQVADVIDLHAALCLADPMSAATGATYYALELVRSYKVGAYRHTELVLRWFEPR